MLTIFSIPKAFEGHIGIIQRNALESWVRLPDCRVVLCGNDPGVAQEAQRLGITHLKDVGCNEYGTPLLDSTFRKVAAISDDPYLCYVNADILLFEDLIKAMKGVPFKNFLMVGQRWDIDLKDSWDFENENAVKLQSHVRAHGKLHPATGSDYFIFPREGGLVNLPAFAVGRPGWDNWFIFRARQLGYPVIDATTAVLIGHQNHDYGHVKKARGQNWDGPEGDENRRLMGKPEHCFELHDATHFLTPDGLKGTWTYEHLRRRWKTLPVLRPRLGWWAQGLERVLNKIGIKVFPKRTAGVS